MFNFMLLNTSIPTCNLLDLIFTDINSEENI